jgi:hypothetical protein
MTARGAKRGACSLNGKARFDGPALRFSRADCFKAANRAIPIPTECSAESRADFPAPIHRTRFLIPALATSTRKPVL